jgi:hypothetical protein
MMDLEKMLQQTACAGCLIRKCPERNVNVAYCSDRKPQLLLIETEKK